MKCCKSCGCDISERGAKAKFCKTCYRHRQNDANKERMRLLRQIPEIRTRLNSEARAAMRRFRAGMSDDEKQKELKRLLLWQQENPERFKESQKRHRAFQKTKREARERANTPSTLKMHEWRSTLRAFGERCAYCENEWQEKDHLIPISKGGGYININIVPACRPCNLAKSDKLPLDFIPKALFYEIVQKLGEAHS